jgi:mono/diheme cytochrome c family protein
MKRTIKTLVAAGIVGSAAATAGAYFGLVNVGADDPHLPIVHAFLTMARERSIEVRSRDIPVPELEDQELIRAGAGNYNAMCVGCHLAPGIAQTELSQALYPEPPDLTKVGDNGNPAATFWTIKHGIKASGMPAWGKSMDDPYIWGMVAFLQKLPELDARQYRSLVASSGGHQHGGGESDMHNHEGQHGGASDDHHAGETAGMNHHDEAGDDHHAGEATGASHHDAAADHHGGELASADHHADETPGASHHDAKPAVEAPKPATKTHLHADGKEHVHAH